MPLPMQPAQLWHMPGHMQARSVWHLVVVSAILLSLRT